MPHSISATPSTDQKQLLHSYEVQLMIRELVEDQAVPLEHILEDTGVSARELENPSLRLTLDQELKLYTRIAHLNKDPLMAHRTGTKLGVANYGILGYAMSTSATVKDAVNLLVEFAPLMSWAAHVVLSYETVGSEQCLCMTLHPTPTDKLTAEMEVESTYSSLHRIFNELVGMEVTFSKVSYAHACRNSDVLPFQKFYNCEIEFEAERNGLYLSRSLLAKRIPHAQPEHASLARDLCAEEVTTLRQDRGLVAAVKAYIESYGEGMPSLDEAAEHFHQSSRTLRRHLQAQGVSFRELLDEARFASAKRYLSSTNLTVEMIGKSLGYADVRSFRTAFKRWAGVAPAQFRSQSRQS